MAPGEAESLKIIPGGAGQNDQATEDSERIARGLGTGGGAGQSFFDPSRPQPSHDSNVHAREGHEGHEEQKGRDQTESDGDSMQADGVSPREREARGTEDPRERGVGA
jgi:hypothetical protein